MQRIEFHYTPKHGSWLNVAECELSCLTSQCLSDRRIGDLATLVAEIAAWGSTLGCSELASDSAIGNVDAHALHCALGFVETERVVCFCMQLNDDQGA